MPGVLNPMEYAQADYFACFFRKKNHEPSIRRPMPRSKNDTNDKKLFRLLFLDPPHGHNLRNTFSTQGFNNGLDIGLLSRHAGG